MAALCTRVLDITALLLFAAKGIGTHASTRRASTTGKSLRCGNGIAGTRSMTRYLCTVIKVPEWDVREPGSILDEINISQTSVKRTTIEKN